MADFKSHITGSTIAGGVYAVVGLTRFDMPVETCIIAGTLCSIGGIIPDLDSDSGRPLRETTLFAAAVAPMMTVQALSQMGMSHEQLVLAALAMYAGARFIVPELFRKLTVHRGMWHSYPACACVGLLAFLIMHPQPTELRLYKSGALVAGFLVHLVMDEIWSIDTRRGRLRLKSSFGTAMKFWGSEAVPNLVVYGLMFLLAYLSYQDVAIVARVRARIDRLNTDQPIVDQLRLPVNIALPEIPSSRDPAAPSTSPAPPFLSTSPAREASPWR